MERVIIVGAGHSGGRLAKYLYENNLQVEVILFGDENCEPYERPPLSKSFLSNKKHFKEFSIFNSEIYEKNNFITKLNNKIHKVDIENKKVYDLDGTSYNYDKIIIANGASPKKISINNSNKINYLRTIEDSIKIKANLENIQNLTIVGAGFIGLEIASTIKKKFPDKKINVIEFSGNILGRNSNDNIRDIIYKLHITNDVHFHFSSQITDIILDKENNLKKIILNNNKEYLSDMIIAGIGVEPNIKIFENSKIDLSDGIKVNEYLQTNIQDTYAIGDIAMYKSLFINEYIREESWNNAEKQSYIVSQNLTDNNTVYNEIPWFWTDQYENNFQILGSINNFDKCIQRNYDNNKFIEFYLKNNNIVGAFAQNTGRDIKITREIIKKNLICDFDLLKNTEYNLKKILK